MNYERELLEHLVLIYFASIFINIDETKVNKNIFTDILGFNKTKHVSWIILLILSPKHKSEYKMIRKKSFAYLIIQSFYNNIWNGSMQIVVAEFMV